MDERVGREPYLAAEFHCRGGASKDVVGAEIDVDPAEALGGDLAAEASIGLEDGHLDARFGAELPGGGQPGIPPTIV